MEKVKEKKSQSGLKETNRPQVKKWQKPTLENVSERVMAQPYIRFT